MLCVSVVAFFNWHPLLPICHIHNLKTVLQATAASSWQLLKSAAQQHVLCA
jgi:hypothetical protein